MSVFLDTAEDMEWLFDVHCPEYRGKAKSAILEGNEDAPSSVTLYADASPRYLDRPVGRMRFIHWEEDRPYPQRPGRT